MSSGIRDPAIGSDDMMTRRPHLDVVTGGGPRGETRTLMSLMRAARVSVVVPTLNEAPNLPYVLDRMPEGVYEIIIVDGRSTDDTIAVARECRPDALIVEQTGRGKGNALACGFWEEDVPLLVELG